MKRTPTQEAAALLGKKGGLARKAKLSPERRREIASLGGKAKKRNARKS